ncbi:hypothetical protein ACJMK2_005416 [Sinanodonta woodiana]|uniref:THAP-type domain-containing protein n=1 Tax=Sinanodonta woodiana TaxID=1069815 RepID=A0ABD3VPY6_SINWO
MMHCVAYGCNQKSDDGTKGFFLFPKDHVYRKKWIKAVGSNIERDGKVLLFCFLHLPSMMVSIGVKMKLNLLKTAVPIIFTETVEYKKKTLPSPEKFGPPKSRRKLYGTLDELLEKNDSQQAEAASEERHLIEEQLPVKELFQQGRKHESYTRLNYQIGLKKGLKYCF